MKLDESSILYLRIVKPASDNTDSMRIRLRHTYNTPFLEIHFYLLLQTNFKIFSFAKEIGHAC